MFKFFVVLTADEIIALDDQFLFGIPAFIADFLLIVIFCLFFLAPFFALFSLLFPSKNNDDG